jgi:ArsR family transcriptional regulator, cadmium/lead-responsive transcriptional repressor
VKTLDVTGDVTIAAKLFRGFADPTRLAIVVALLEGEQRVKDLVDRLGCSQANVSAHLACLKECELVTDRPEGRAVYYRIAHDDVVSLLQAAEGLLSATGTAIDICSNYTPEGRDERRP